MSGPRQFRKLQKPPENSIFNGFWCRANRIFICVVHGQVMKIKTFIWLELKRIIKHVYILSINKIFDINSILTMNSNLQIGCAIF
jgi:hypothetical protein